MRFSQGRESVHNGSWLEKMIEDEVRKRNIPVLDYVIDANNEDLFEPVRLIRRVPYKGLYGTESVSEFVLQFYQRRTRIECRVQENAGSVDEKFPHLFLNARDCMPESEVLIVLAGTGARWQAVAWLKNECERVQAKRIHLFDFQQFRAWLKGLS